MKLGKFHWFLVQCSIPPKMWAEGICLGLIKSPVLRAFSSVQCDSSTPSSIFVIIQEPPFVSFFVFCGFFLSEHLIFSSQADYLCVWHRAAPEVNTLSEMKDTSSSSPSSPFYASTHLCFFFFIPPESSPGWNKPSGIIPVDPLRLSVACFWSKWLNDWTRPQSTRAGGEQASGRPEMQRCCRVCLFSQSPGCVRDGGLFLI